MGSEIPYSAALHAGYLLTGNDPLSVPESALPGEIILDLIESGDYTLTGIGYCTGIHEDAIQDVVAGLNASPSLALFYRLAELHQFARKDLYEKLKRAIVLSIFQRNHPDTPFTESMMLAI